MSIFRKVYRIINGLIRRGYWYNNVKFKDCSKFWCYKTFNTDVVNLGSTSSVFAFNYSGIPLKCANWALSTNPLAGDLAILKNYVSYLKEGATVIIPLCPFTSLAGGYSISEDHYYSLLYPSTIPCYSIRRHNKVKLERQTPLLAYPLLSLFSDLKHLVVKPKQKVMTENEMEKDAQTWMSNWKKEFSVSDFSYPLLLKNQDAIVDAAKVLNEIVAFCKERNIRSVILIPPVYHTLGELFTPEIRKKIIDSLIERVEDKSVWYHNYMDDSEFTNDTSLFQSSFLMNEKGAKIFTRRALTDLDIIIT